MDQKERPGDGDAGPERSCIPSRNSPSIADLDPRPQAARAIQTDARHVGKRERRTEAAKEVLAVLIELFPKTFTFPPRPLKIGLGADLVARGILTPAECGEALGRFTARLSYQRALVLGGPRFDLAGDPSGEITPAQIEVARTRIAHLEARAIAKAAQVKARRKRQVERSKKSAEPKQQFQQPRRIGLADLKRAAEQRRNKGGRDG